MPSARMNSATRLLLLLVGHHWCAAAQVSTPALVGVDQSNKTVAADTVDTIPLKSAPATNVTRNTETDLIHVIYADPSLGVSRVLPNGVAFNESNASSLGDHWERATRTDLDQDEFLLSGVESAHVANLLHGIARGTNTIRVDAASANANANANANESILAQALSSVEISATLSVPRHRYALRESVVLTGSVAEGSLVLLNPSMSLDVMRTNPVASGLSISNLRFVRTQTRPGGRYRHDFTADLVSQNVQAPIVLATVSSGNNSVDFFQSSLSFLAVKAGLTSTTPTNISVDTDDRVAPPTSGWMWSFETTQPPVKVPIQDAGAQDGVPGDGLFTAVFPATQPGRYSAVLTGTGTTPSGAEYRRIAATSFQVFAEGAKVLGCSDQTWDDNGNGYFDRLQVSMQVQVAQDARYRLHLDLADAQGHRLSADRNLWLTAGDSVVAVDFSGREIRREFTANGPYQRLNAQLWFIDGYQKELLSTTACGSTQPYQLTSFEPEPIQLTGTATLTPVNQNGTPGYERLDFSQVVVAPSGACHWYVELTSADGTRLDTANGNGVSSGGSRTLTASFNGPKINRSGKGGPYQVSSLEITCSGHRLDKKNAAVSALYSASDFEQVPADFTVSALNITAQPGILATSQVTASAIGGFEGEIALTINGLPSAWTASLRSPVIGTVAGSYLDIVPAGNASPGTYSFNVNATSGTLTHSSPVSVVITSLPVTLAIQPGYAALHPGQTKQFTAQVFNAPDSSLHWYPPARGTLANGLYQAPAVIDSMLRIYVVAKSNLDSTKYASAYVRLLPPAQVTVTPATAILHAGQDIFSLRATVTNVDSPQVIWTMSPQVGTLTQTCAICASYVAPNSVATTQTVTITATSVEDPTQSASMTITLQP